MINLLLNTNGRLLATVQSYIKQQLGMPQDTKIGSRIGSESVNGVVYELGNDSKFVLKVMLEKITFEADFKNEVRVGHIQGIEKVGTKIYNSSYGPIRTRDGVLMYLGTYIMDHLKGGDANSQVVTLDKYVRRYYGKSCPKTKDTVLQMYVDLIFQFYQITKGWHADLHAENIQVILKKDGSVKTMKVIDYGSHTPFKRDISKMTCLDDVLDAINLNWKNIPNNNAQNSGWPLFHKFPENKNKSQLIHSNAGAIRNAGMHSMYYMAKKRRLTKPNGGKRLTIMKKRIGLKPTYRLKK